MKQKTYIATFKCGTGPSSFRIVDVSICDRDGTPAGVWASQLLAAAKVKARELPIVGCFSMYELVSGEWVNFTT